MRYRFALYCLLSIVAAVPLCAQRSYQGGYETGNFEVTNGIAVPLSSEWISRGVEVVDGDRFTFQPPSPQGKVSATNASLTLTSPVFRLNRLGLNGEERGAGRHGDTLLSRAVDLRDQQGAVLSFSVQRTGRPPGGTFSRGWADSLRVGPESRVIRSGDTLSAIQEPDEFIVEFSTVKAEDEDIPESAWNRHFRPGGEITNNPAYTLFGGGGHRRGFHEKNYDSSLTRVQGLRVDLYDDGRDDRFLKVFIPIPSWMLADPEAAKNFRFRFRVSAQNNSASTGLPVDDADDFYIDNIYIILPKTPPDLELTSLGFTKRFAVMPQYTATDMPITVRIANTATIGAASFTVQVECSAQTDTLSEYYYSRIRAIPFLPAMREVTIDMPHANLPMINNRSGNNYKTNAAFVIRARIQAPWTENHTTNNFSDRTDTLHFADSYGHAPGSFSSRNDVPAATGQPGKGLNLPARAVGDSTWPRHQTGDTPGNNEGWIAVQFAIPTLDTLHGYKAVWGSAGDCTSHIQYALYRNGETRLPDVLVPGSELTARRCLDDVAQQYRTDGEYATALLKKPLALMPGTYWLAVRSLNGKPLELGGSAYGAGILTTSDDTENGVNNVELGLDDRFRMHNLLAQLINRPTSVWRNSSSEQWKSFIPDTGNPAYAYLDHAGAINNHKTYSRGTWIPLLRPYFGSTPMITDIERSCGRYVFIVSDGALNSCSITERQNVLVTQDSVRQGTMHRYTVVAADSTRSASFRIIARNARGGTLDYPVVVMSKPFITADHSGLEGSAGVSYQWYWNGQPIPGAVSRTYYPPGNGSYSVEVRDMFGCTSISAPYQYKAVTTRAHCRTAAFSIRASTSAHVSYNCSGCTFTAKRVNSALVDITIHPPAGFQSPYPYTIEVEDGMYSRTHTGTFLLPPTMRVHPDPRHRSVRITAPTEQGYTYTLNNISVMAANNQIVNTDAPGLYIVQGRAGMDICGDHVAVKINEDVCRPPVLEFERIVTELSPVDTATFNVYYKLDTMNGRTTLTLSLIDPAQPGYYAFSLSPHDGDTLYIGRIFPAPPMLTIHADAAHRRVRVTGPADTTYSYTLSTPITSGIPIVPVGNELIDTDEPGQFSIEGSAARFLADCASSTGWVEVRADECDVAKIAFGRVIHQSSLVDTATSNIRYFVSNSSGHSVITISLIDSQRIGYYALRAEKEDPLYIGRIFPLPTASITTAGNNLLRAEVEGNPDNVLYQWTLEGVSINGANAQLLAPAVDGIYRVIVTDTNGCQGISEPYQYAAVSVADAPHTDRPELGISPNPASDAVHFHLALPDVQHIRLVICDVFGRKVATVFEGIPEGQVAIFRFSASGLPAGVYFCRLETPSGTVIRQLQVRR